MEDACHVSKHIGLAFIGGDYAPSGTIIELDVWQSVYLFYRKRIFEAMCRRRRDGGRIKRLREVLQKLTSDLQQRDSHDNNPKNINILSSDTLDGIVSAVVYSPSVNVLDEAGTFVPRLEGKWTKLVTCRKNSRSDNIKMEDVEATDASAAEAVSAGENDQDESSSINSLQLSITYLELFVSHEVSILGTYELE